MSRPLSGVRAPLENAPSEDSTADLTRFEPGTSRVTSDADIERARSQEYALLGSLLLRAPVALLLEQLSALPATSTPLGIAHKMLAERAAATSPEVLEREYFDLFIGVGRGELMPYASYYLTGSLHDRPLAKLRDDLRRLGLERTEGHCDPEDHIGTLCEIMSGLVDGSFAADANEQAQFFARHLGPWAAGFFADLEAAKSANFYQAVGGVGRTFIDIEAEAFAMET